MFQEFLNPDFLRGSRDRPLKSPKEKSRTIDYLYRGIAGIDFIAYFLRTVENPFSWRNSWRCFCLDDWS